MQESRSPRSGRWLLAAAALLLLLGAGAAGYFYWQRNQQPPQSRSSLPSTAPQGSISEQVHHFCGGCHAYPPPDTFPKSAWKEEVERGFTFFNTAGRNLRPPPIDDVVKYYVDQAPEELPKIPPDEPSLPPSVRFEPIHLQGPPQKDVPAISHVAAVALTDAKRLDLLICDMRSGLISVMTPADAKPAWKVLGKGTNPARAEVVDLDGDGVKDLLVADLGNFAPTDRRCGSVVWLRGRADGTFTPVTLFEDIGRVADVQAADFRGVGKLDLIVASFGWNNIGEIYYLENQTTDWSKPKFVAKEIDTRHGAIHVPVIDLNRDGKPDFIALFGQEHEAVVAFLNQGGGEFRKEIIFRAHHPGYGSSGIQLVDMNGDGHTDVLYTNGDTLDSPHLLKPYHGVQWLENPGTETFPWKRHEVAAMYGAHRALAADISGQGRMDIVAASFLPAEAFPQRESLKLDAMLFFEALEPGRYARHRLEAGTCNHVSCAVGDLFGTGRNDIITATFAATAQPQVVTIWKNLGR
jgi:hypothetical protein